MKKASFITIFAVGLSLLALTLTGCIGPEEPDPVDDDLRLLVNTSKQIDVAQNDGWPSGDANYEVALQAEHGTVQLITGSIFLYTPDTDYVGTDQFIYRAFNSYGIAHATVDIVVKETNAAPVVVGETIYEIYQQALSVDLAVNDIDPDDGDELTYQLIEPDRNLFTLEETSLHVTLRSNSIGIYVVYYEVSDGIESRQGSVIIHTLPRPTLVNDEAITKLNKEIAIMPLINDTFPEFIPAQTLTIKGVYFSEKEYTISSIEADSTNYELSIDGFELDFTGSVTGYYYIVYEVTNQEGFMSRSTARIRIHVTDEEENWFDSWINSGISLNTSLIMSVAIITFFVLAAVGIFAYDRYWGSIKKIKK